MKLTAQEYDLLDAVARGLSGDEVAERVGLTGGTTRVYLSKLYKKIGVRNKTEAAVWFLRTRPPKPKINKAP